MSGAGGRFTPAAVGLNAGHDNDADMNYLVLGDHPASADSNARHPGTRTATAGIDIFHHRGVAAVPSVIQSSVRLTASLAWNRAVPLPSGKKFNRLPFRIDVDRDVRHRRGVAPAPSVTQSSVPSTVLARDNTSPLPGAAKLFGFKLAAPILISINRDAPPSDHSSLRTQCPISIPIGNDTTTHAVRNASTPLGRRNSR
jgi:hypothetical protein